MMEKKEIYCLLLFVISSFSGKAQSQNSFFAMSYGFEGVPVEEQIRFLRQAGYDGIGAWVNNPAKLDEFRKMMSTPQIAGGQLTIFGVYMPLNHNNDEHRRLITEVLQSGAPEKVPIWLAIRDPKKTATLKTLASYLQSVCEEAAKFGTDVILYPHDRHFAASAEQTIDLIKATDRPNLFTSIHLNHELRAGNADRLEEVVKRALPYARLASISGADLPGRYNRGARDWSDVVQALSTSDFDVAHFYRLLKKYGYEGPIGYNNFKIPGDVQAHHLETLSIYRSWETED